MKHILVIADPAGSEQIAFHKALELAKLTVAEVHVVVFCYEPVSYSGEREEGEYLNIKNLLIHQADQWWQNFLQAEAPGEPVTHVVVWEKYIHNWVVEHSKTAHYDLIVKTGHRSETPFYTPTDWHLFRESPVPVYCVSEEQRKTQKVVLAALDILSNSKEKQALNKNILEAAFQLAVQMDATLHCCYAIHIPTLVKDMDLIDVAARTRQLEENAREKLTPLLELYDMDDQQLHISQGVPWKVLTSLSQKLKASCVVVGSMGRRGIPGKLIGNTAEKVIHFSHTDLLVLGGQAS